jgi:hypothetical protein
MRPLLGVVGVALIGLMLAEFFVTFLLPRRVKRDPRIARQFFTIFWWPWRALARRFPERSRDTMLGLFAPLAFVGVLGLWVAGLILGFGCLLWAVHAKGAGGAGASLGDTIYYSAATFFTASHSVFLDKGTVERILTILETAAGFAVLFVVIGYLPALYQAFSRREIHVSQLDARAGSPPSVGGLLLREPPGSSWEDLHGFLAEWEEWTAELMETHLAYPVLAYFRSQHVNQSWLSALTAVLDTCAFTMAAAPELIRPAELTLAIGRHALADLAYSFRATPDEPDRPVKRDDDQNLERLWEIAEDHGFALTDKAPALERLDELRGMYEPYAAALARTLELELPAWLGEETVENWRLSSWRTRRVEQIP